MSDGITRIVVRVEAEPASIKYAVPGQTGGDGKEGAVGPPGPPGADGSGAEDPGDLTLIFNNKLV